MKKKKIGGWKTKFGAFLLSITPVIDFVIPGGSVITGSLGQAMIGVGIAHKIVKSQNT